MNKLLVVCLLAFYAGNSALPRQATPASKPKPADTSSSVSTDAKPSQAATAKVIDVCQDLRAALMAFVEDTAAASNMSTEDRRANERQHLAKIAAARKSCQVPAKPPAEPKPQAQH